MAALEANRNLLFGLLALQTNLVTREDLVTAVDLWLKDTSKRLDEILLSRQSLDKDDHDLLSALIEKHLARHGGSVEQSLAAVSCLASASETLASLGGSDSQVTVSLIEKVADDATSPTHGSASNRSGQRFRVLRRHAKGGLGEVFVAQDLELHREVALKEIQPRFAHDTESRARFVLEAEITGSLEHPGIVPVYGLGQYGDGRPFYAMRFIKGDSLKEAVDQFHDHWGSRGQSDESSRPAASTSQLTYASLEFRKLLGRFVDVCQAIEYAHCRGVLHRDLKPGNIMLGKYGETLVVDWGLAKAIGSQNRPPSDGESPLRPTSVNDSLKSVVGQVIGTPAFMSPEQAAGRIDELGVASDVYSLGATLYYVLTGLPPFASNQDGNLLRRVERGEFAPPRSFNPGIPKPLEAICLRAMSLQPERRYASPIALADDIEHYLADESIAALPDTLSDKLTRVARRHRTLVRTAAAALFVIAAVSTVAAVLVNEQRMVNARLARDNGELAVEKGKLADAKGQLAQENGNLATLEKAARDEAETKSKSLQLALAKNSFTKGLAEYDAGREDQGLRDLQRSWMLANPESPWRTDIRQVLLDRTVRGGKLLAPPLRHPHQVLAIAISPDGDRIVTGCADQYARLWNLRTASPVGQAMPHESWVQFVAFSPDGRRVATGADGAVRIWSAESGKPLSDVVSQWGSVTALVFSPEGSCLAVAGADGLVKRLHSTTGVPLGKPLQHESSVGSLAFSPDGKRVITASGNAARLWNAGDGSQSGAPMEHKSLVGVAVFSPDGEQVVTGGYDQTIRFWNAHTGEPRGEPLQVDGQTELIRFSPNGKQLASSSGISLARLWSVETRKQITKPLVHPRVITWLDFSPDGELLATCDQAQIRLWDATTGVPRGAVFQHSEKIESVAFSPSGDQLVAGGWDRAAFVWNPKAGLPLGQTASFREGAHSSPDGERRCVVGDDENSRRIRDANNVLIGPPLRHDGPIRDVSFSPDGEKIVTCGADKTARMWNARSGEMIGAPLEHEGVVSRVYFSPDGERFATVSDGRWKVHVWETATQTPVCPPLAHDGFIIKVAFSPNGRFVATSSLDKTARLWDLNSGKVSGATMPHPKDVVSFAFDPKGRTLATGCHDNHVRLWDAATGTPLLEPMQGHERPVFGLRFSPEGSRLASFDQERNLRLWDTETGAPLGLVRHGTVMGSYAFSPNGSRIATTSGKSALVWDSRLIVPLGVPLQHADDAVEVRFEGNGAELRAAIISSPSATLWESPASLVPQDIDGWLELWTGSRFEEPNEIVEFTEEQWREAVRKSRVDLVEHAHNNEAHSIKRHRFSLSNAERRGDQSRKAFHARWITSRTEHQRTESNDP